MANGEYGIKDVSLSMLSVVGRTGFHGHLLAPLSDMEIVQMRRSADCLKDVIKQIRF